MGCGSHESPHGAILCNPISNPAGMGLVEISQGKGHGATVIWEQVYIKGNVARVHGGEAMRDDKFDCVFYPPVLQEPLVCLGVGEEFGMRIFLTSPVVQIEWHKHAAFVNTMSGSRYVVISHEKGERVNCYA